MGITGLLPFLKKIHQQVNVSQFAGCTVAVDAYCWLHKGGFSCAEKLARGEKTEQYVYYCMKFVELLLKAKVKPVMVFDGAHLKSKSHVEKDRREKRENMRKKAANFLREGKRAEAIQCMQASVDITPSMARNLIDACRARGVDCIVAPYEADAQIAFLNLQGIAQLVITEDSDLLTFGCEKVLFKMDHQGNGVLIDKSRLNEVLGFESGSLNTFEKFRHMCILSGCDYLPRMKGIGLGMAFRVFKVARQTDVRQLLKKLSIYLKKEVTVPDKYIEDFIQAENTFLYQLVFDPLTRTVCPLTPYPPEINEDELHYAGQYNTAVKALQMALGNLDFYTHQLVGNFDPNTYVPKVQGYRPELSIWSTDYMADLYLQQTQNIQGAEKRTVHIPQIGVCKRMRDASKSKDAQKPEAKKQKTSMMGLDETEMMEYIEKDVDDEHSVDSCIALLSSDGENDYVISPKKSNDKRISLTQKERVDPLALRLSTEPRTSHVVSEESGEDEDIENRVVEKKKRSPVKISAATIGDETFFETSLKKPIETELQAKTNKNMFAAPTGAKPKFNLNATVAKTEVRSRYFFQGFQSSSSSPKKSPRKSVSPMKRNKTPESAERGGIRQLFSEQLKTISLKKESSKSDSIGSICKKVVNSPLVNIKQTPKNRKPMSGSSAFAWSKFKFSPRQDTMSPASSKTVDVDIIESPVKNDIVNSVDLNCDKINVEETKDIVEHKDTTHNKPISKLSSYFNKSSKDSVKKELILDNAVSQKESIQMSMQKAKSIKGSPSLSNYFHTSSSHISSKQSKDSQRPTEHTPGSLNSQESDNDVIPISICGYADYCKSLTNDDEGKDDLALLEDVSNKIEGISQDSVATTGSVASSSQRSSSLGKFSLGSIDSFCRPNTQELVDLTEEGDSQEATQVSSKGDNRLSSPPVVKQSPCRVSGLSRGKTTKAKQNNKSKLSLAKSQPKLDSLSRFAFTRNKIAK